MLNVIVCRSAGGGTREKKIPVVLLLFRLPENINPAGFL